MQRSTVPGPPRGRRREAVGDVVRRVQSMRESEELHGRPGSPLLRFTRDVILLVRDLLTDARVPRRDKALTVGAVAFAVSRVSRIPRRNPVLGLIEGLGVTLLALRHLLAGAGYTLIYELWYGSDEGLALVLTLGGVQE